MKCRQLDRELIYELLYQITAEIDPDIPPFSVEWTENVLLMKWPATKGRQLAVMVEVGRSRVFRIQDGLVNERWDVNPHYRCPVLPSRPLLHDSA